MNLLSSTFCISQTDERLTRKPDSLVTSAQLAAISLRQQALLGALLDPANSKTAAEISAQELAFLEVAPSDLTLSEVARLAVALRITSVRDQLWLRIDAGAPASWALHVLPLLVEHYRTPPLFLYSWACWRAGDVAVAKRALRHALAADPGYSAGRLLRVALDAGIHPDNVPLLSSGVSPESVMLAKVGR